MKEAVYIVEYASIPTGIDILDKMVKRAPAVIIQARPICVGKYLIVLGGAVEDMREVRTVVETVGAEKLLSQHLLTGAHRDILAYFKRVPADEGGVSGGMAAGVFETLDIANGFCGLDAALKSGNVRLEHIWLGHFIGGKFCFLVTGSVADVAAALKAAENVLGGKSFADKKLIPSPDPKMFQQLFQANM